MHHTSSNIKLADSMPEVGQRVASTPEYAHHFQSSFAGRAMVVKNPLVCVEEDGGGLRWINQYWLEYAGKE